MRFKAILHFAAVAGMVLAGIDSQGHCSDQLRTNAKSEASPVMLASYGGDYVLIFRCRHHTRWQQSQPMSYADAWTHARAARRAGCLADVVHRSNLR